MSQHDYNIANGGGAAVRADLNNALLAVLSQNSGATAPTTTKPFMPWYDTTTGTLRMRNAADTAWVNALDGVFGSGNMGMVNRVINGRMEVDQLNTAAAALTATDGGYTLDMYQTFTQAGEGVFTVQQVADAPSGYKSSAKITVTTADASIGASQRYLFLNNIEGKDVADLGFGTANAQAVTVSFWVKSSVTGSHSGTLINAGFNRAYPFNITINAANTWEQKFVNIAGDTTGTWLTDTLVGMRLVFDLGSGTSQRGAANAWGTAGFGVTGAVSLISTVNATMNITGVDLRKGTYASAPPADWRPYGAELALSNRYFVELMGGTNNYQPLGLADTYSTTAGSYCIHVPVPMRAIPSLTVVGNVYLQNLGNVNISAFAGPYSQKGTIVEGDFTMASSVTTNQCGFMRFNNVNTATARFNFSARL